MHHGLTYPNAEEAIKLKKRFNQPVPEELIPPELHDVEFALWLSFWELSTERQAGFEQLGRIRWSAMQHYAKMQGVEPRMFMRIIKAMDDAYLAHQSGSTQGKQAFNKEMFKR